MCTSALTQSRQMTQICQICQKLYQRPTRTSDMHVNCSCSFSRCRAYWYTGPTLMNGFLRNTVLLSSTSLKHLTTRGLVCKTCLCGSAKNPHSHRPVSIFGMWVFFRGRDAPNLSADIIINPYFNPYFASPTQLFAHPLLSSSYIDLFEMYCKINRY